MTARCSPSPSRMRSRPTLRQSRTHWPSSSSPSRQPSRAAQRIPEVDRRGSAQPRRTSSRQPRPERTPWSQWRSERQSRRRSCRRLEGRLASLRSTYATLLSFSSGSATNLLTVVEPADAPTIVGAAEDAPQHASRRGPRAAGCRRHRVPRGAAGRLDQGPGDHPGRRRSEHPGNDRAACRALAASPKSTCSSDSSIRVQALPRPTARCARMSSSPPWMRHCTPSS